MTLTIVIIAAVTVLFSTALIASGISTRPTTPCLFDKQIVTTGITRLDGGRCSGKPENVYVSAGGPTEKLHGVRVCNGHVRHLLDLVDAVARESK
jgi:hypothetical protein